MRASRADYHKKWLADRIAKNLCKTCDNAPTRGMYCDDCRIINTVRAKRQYAKYKAAGLCCVCGNQPLADNRLCKTCYLKNMARRHLGHPKYWKQLEDKLKQQNYLCTYSGLSITLGKDAWIDHIKPQKHFPKLRQDINNMEWVHADINEMKRDHSQEKFLDLIDKIYKNRKLS